MSGPLTYDRVLETSATSGTGTFTLAGAVAGFQSFAVVGNGNTCYYVAYEVDGNGISDGDWEVGLGTYTSSGTTLSRDLILASSNSGAAVNFDGTERIGLSVPGHLIANLYGRQHYNYVINGGFDIAQRQVRGTPATIADAGYSADRWKILRENADVQYSGQDGTADSGITAMRYGRYDKITNAGKFAVYQILEYRDAAPLRGRTVIFQAKLKANTSRTFRMAVFELQNAGTADTVPSLFSSMASADSTDPTKGANIAAITATAVSGAQGTVDATPGNSALSCSVTTSWQQFALSCAIPSNSKNIIVAFWSDADVATATGVLYVTEVGLYDGASLRAWWPRLEAAELDLCQRYYEKSYAIGTAPGTAFGGGAGNMRWAHASAHFGAQIIFKTRKRVSPTVTVYDSAGTSARVDYYTTSWNAGGTLAASITSEVGYYPQHTIASSIWTSFEFTASSEL